jgi:hypothetical protein
MNGSTLGSLASVYEKLHMVKSRLIRGEGVRRRFSCDGMDANGQRVTKKIAGPTQAMRARYNRDHSQFGS